MGDIPCSLLNYALHAAVGNNDRSSVHQVLQEGTDVNILDEYGQRALHIAVHKGFLGIVELLLKHGADPNLSYRERSAFQIAVQRKDVALTRLLLDHGADPNPKDTDGNNSLHFAGLLQEVELVKILLINGVDVNCTNNHGDTPLHIVTEYGTPCLVRELFRFGANPNILNNNGCSALDIAVSRGEENLVKMLLAHNADPNLTNNRGNSALHTNIIKNFRNKHRDALVKLLLDHLAYPNIKNNIDDSALHLAVCCAMNDTWIVRKLLACGADLNIRNCDGDSALHRAVYYSDLSVVKALLEAGADVTDTNNRGLTPLHLAQCQNVAFCLLEKGAPINVQDKNGQTPLHRSVSGFDWGRNIVEPLLFAGAKLDILDSEGKTFIHMYENCDNPHTDIALSKFIVLNIKRNFTYCFDIEGFDIESLAHELKKVKSAIVEGLCMYNVLKYSVRDFSMLHNKSFRNAIRKEHFKNAFPQLYTLTRLCEREAEILKSLVEELSAIFAYHLTTTMVLNVPQEVCRLIIFELDSDDIKNLKIAFC